MSLLIRLKPKRRRVIAEVGNVRLHELVLTMEGASAKDADLVRISRQNLLPSRTSSEYVTIRTAHKETGLSEGTIRRLAREGKIDAMKVQGVWLVLRESLFQYIQENER